MNITFEVPVHYIFWFVFCLNFILIELNLIPLWFGRSSSFYSCLESLLELNHVILEAKMADVFRIAWLEVSAKVSNNPFTVFGLVAHHTNLQTFVWSLPRFYLDFSNWCNAFLCFLIFAGTNRKKTIIFRELCDQTVWYILKTTPNTKAS